MKKTATLCLIAAAAFSCRSDNKINTPDFGERAEVATVEAAQNAIDGGSSEIVILNALTGDGSLVIPKKYTEEGALSIEVPAGGNSLTLTQGTGPGYFPDLSLMVGGANDLTLDLPGMSVVFDGDVSGALTASTAVSTLTIAPDATVNTLNVTQGNVRKLGTVTNFGMISASSNILWPVATAGELRTRMTVTPYNNVTNGGVVFTADIAGIVEPDTELNGVGAITGAQGNQDAFRLGAAPTQPQPEIPYDGYIIDGNGHSLSGAAFNNVLAIYADGVTIRDLTIFQTVSQKSLKRLKNSVLENTNDDGVSVYASLNAKLFGVTVRDCGKYGMVVNGSTATATNLTTSGNAWGGVNVADGSALTDRPGFVLVSGNIGEERAIVAQAESDVTVPAGWTRVEIEEGFLYSPPAE